MNIIWRQWIVLPRPPNVFVTNNFGSLFKHGQAKWMVWIRKPLHPSSTLPHTLFYNVSPWSTEVCFIALCKVPCVLQNRTIVTATFPVSVVWDLDVFPFSLPLFSLGHLLFSELAHLSNQQVMRDWCLLYLGTPWVLCQEFVTNLRHAALEKIIPAKW